MLTYLKKRVDTKLKSRVWLLIVNVCEKNNEPDFDLKYIVYCTWLKYETAGRIASDAVLTAKFERG